MQTNYVAEGDKAALRFMTIEDCELIVRWRNQPEVRARYVYREPFTLEGEIAYYRKEVETHRIFFLMIVEKESGRAVGACVFNSPDPMNNQFESGLFIGERDALGKGLGREAFFLATRYVFANWPFTEGKGTRKLMSRIFTDNEASMRTHLKVGYKKAGILKDVHCSDGTVKDMMQLFLTDEDI